MNENHYFNFKPRFKVVAFSREYIHFHLDEKWINFNTDIHNNLIKFLELISINENVVITSNLGDNFLFNTVNYKFKKNKNFYFVKSPNFFDLISIIYFAKTCVSSHSGFIVHLAACYNKNIIDIVHKNIFNELDRWIPFNTKYKRYDIENFDKINLD